MIIYNQLFWLSTQNWALNVWKPCGFFRQRPPLWKSQRSGDKWCTSPLRGMVYGPRREHKSSTGSQNARAICSSRRARGRVCPRPGRDFHILFLHQSSVALLRRAVQHSIRARRGTSINLSTSEPAARPRCHSLRSSTRVAPASRSSPIVMSCAQNAMGRRMWLKPNNNAHDSLRECFMYYACTCTRAH